MAAEMRLRAERGPSLSPWPRVAACPATGRAQAGLPHEASRLWPRPARCGHPRPARARACFVLKLVWPYLDSVPPTANLSPVNAKSNQSPSRIPRIPNPRSENKQTIGRPSTVVPQYQQVVNRTWQALAGSLLANVVQCPRPSLGRT